jgi:hypothetical protein
MKTTVDMIEAATIPTRAQAAGLRSEPQVTRTRAIRGLLKSLGIKGVFCTSAKGSMCNWTNVDFDGIRCNAGIDHERRSCPVCQRNIAAERKLNQIILGGFPDLDDRCDSQSDHFDFMFAVSVHEPREEQAAPAATLAPVVTVVPDSVIAPVDPELRKLSHFQPTPRPTLALVQSPVIAEPTVAAADTARAEEPPKYEAVSQPPPATVETGKFIGNAADVWTDARGVAKEEKREFFLCYFLDVRHRLIGERWTMAIGSLCGVEVHPRELFHEAIKRAASAIIVCHNHPSQDPTPSRQDMELTTRIRSVGELCGIDLLDHVVIASEGFVSMASRGWA